MKNYGINNLYNIQMLNGIQQQHPQNMDIIILYALQ